jgi:uncharacterized protein YbjQ (UPF0145 family)
MLRVRFHLLVDHIEQFRDLLYLVKNNALGFWLGLDEVAQAFGARRVVSVRLAVQKIQAKRVAKMLPQPG